MNTKESYMKKRPREKLANLTPEQVDILEDILWDYQSSKKEDPKFKPNIYIEKLLNSLKNNTP